MKIFNRDWVSGPRRLLLAGAVMSLSTGIAGAQINVTTYHNDNSRTGQNVQETILTPANVNSAQFGRLFSLSVDGYVYAQPLYLSGVNIGGGTHNVVYVATEHDSLYAIDGDSGALYWAISLIAPGGTTVSASDIACTDLVPEIGISGTPAIDTTTGTLYVVAKSSVGGVPVQYLHAIDVGTGAEKFGGPTLIQGSVPGNTADGNGTTIPFDPRLHNQRAGLLLENGHVVIAWASHCDIVPWHGWIMSYNAATLAQEAIDNDATAILPGGDQNGCDGIWMAGAGMAADAAGNVYFASGNGAWNGGSDLGDSVVKLGPPTGGSFPVLDYFTPWNQQAMADGDIDLGSGGVILLPTTKGGKNLIAQMGKLGIIYLMDTTNLGKSCTTLTPACTTSDTQIVQEITGATTGIWGSPAYWNGWVYWTGSNDSIKAFSFDAGGSGKFSLTPTSQSTAVFPFASPNPVISANGTTNGILWGLDNQHFLSNCRSDGKCQALYAYDATNLGTLLYTSNQAAGGRDVPGAAVKFTSPTVANGKVYVPTQSTLSVYGLLPAASTVTLNPTSLPFAGQTVNSSSASQTATLTNTGSAAVTISSISVSGANAANFSLNSTCGTTLAAAGTCTIGVVYSPGTGIGAMTAQLNVIDSVGTQSVLLSGTGLAPVVPQPLQFNPISLNFGSQVVNTKSTAQVVTVTNTGTSAVSIASIAAVGGTPASFPLTTTCATSLPASGSCTISVVFAPGGLGGRFSTLTWIGGSGTLRVPLAGTGVPVPPSPITLTPASLTFPAQTVNTQSAAQVITVTNTGSSAVTITSITDVGGTPPSFPFTTTCGTTLAAGGSCTVSVVFAPGGVGVRSTTLTLVDGAGTQTAALSGTGATAGPSVITLSPSSLTFPAQTVNTQSAPQVVTVTNTGASSVAISSLSDVGGTPPSFPFTTTCGTSLASGASCTVSVVFQPGGVGARASTLTLVDGVGTQTVPLSGTGATSAPSQITLNPASLTFPSQTVNTQSAPQVVTVTNSGSSAVTITSITDVGGTPPAFPFTSTCGASLAAGASCTVSVAFAPGGTGTRYTTLTLADSAGTQTVPLSGTGAVAAPSQVTTSPASVTFPLQIVNTSSAPQTITVTNTGSSAVSITGIADVTGTPAAFPFTTTCGSSLAAGAACAVNVTFLPGGVGSRATTLTLTDSAGTQTVALTGTGVANPLTLSPATLTFAPQTVKTTSAPQIVTLANSGSSAISIGSIADVGGTPAAFPLTTTCGASIAAGASCTVSVVFAPGGTGLRTSTLTVVDGAGTQTVALSGTGQ